MSNRLKFIIGNKIIPHITELPLKMARAIDTYHGRGDSSFCLDFNQKIYSEIESNQLLQSLHCNDYKSTRIVDRGSTKIRIQFERNFLIKNVLEEIISPTTKVETVPKKIVMDFSSPNIAKPFHIGHLRSTIIGNFIANINTHFQNEVVKINYLGDWGTQFGLLKIGLREKNIDSETLKNDPINVLYRSYVYANKLAETDPSIMDEARQYFSDVERGISDLSNWKEICKLTVNELTSTYQRLGVTFDVYNWESDYNAKAIQDVINLLTEKNVLRTDEHGRKVASSQNRDVVVMKSDNSTMYLSRDIAALLDRHRMYQFDKMLYVVDSSQADHFTALFEIARTLDDTFAHRCEHVKFGRVKGMSSRKGTVVFLKDILNEAKNKMYEQQLQSPNTRNSTLDDNTCDVLGTTAVIINDLKQRRLKDYVFDWDRALQTQGDSGIKLQYLHCRLYSIEANCGVRLPTECIPTYLPEPLVSDLVTELAKFDDILNKSREEMEACILVNYLLRLAKHINKAVNNLRVMNEMEDVARQRLLLFHASRLVIKKGLGILGVKPLNEISHQAIFSRPALTRTWRTTSAALNLPFSLYLNRMHTI